MWNSWLQRTSAYDHLSMSMSQGLKVDLQWVLLPLGPISEEPWDTVAGRFGPWDGWKVHQSTEKNKEQCPSGKMRADLHTQTVNSHSPIGGHLPRPPGDCACAVPAAEDTPLPLLCHANSVPSFKAQLPDSPSNPEAFFLPSVPIRHEQDSNA